MNMKLNAVNHILSDARGIYIPRDFICDANGGIAFDHCARWGLTKDNVDQWSDAAFPESDFYWDSWEWILNHAEYTDENGNKYRLHHDGDLWGLCYERMSEEEKQNFGFEA